MYVVKPLEVVSISLQWFAINIGAASCYFSYQKSILEELVMENVVIFSGHLEYFLTIWYIKWANGNFVHMYEVIWYIFSVLVYCTKKNLATLINISENAENA
jgi:hypothetical protein